MRYQLKHVDDRRIRLDDENQCNLNEKFKTAASLSSLSAVTVNAQIRHSFVILKNIVFPNSNKKDQSNRDTFLSGKALSNPGRGVAPSFYPNGV